MKKSILLAACFLMTLTVAAQNDTLANERDITLVTFLTIFPVLAMMPHALSYHLLSTR